MSIAEILPLVKELPHSEKYQLIHVLLDQLAQEEKNNIEADKNHTAAAILQRMADRNALSHIEDPLAWQKEIREDRPLFGRE